MVKKKFGTVKSSFNLFSFGFLVFLEGFHAYDVQGFSWW